MKARARAGWRHLSLPLRVFLIVVGGLLLGLAAALSGFGGHTEEPQAQTTSCSETGGAATVAVGTGVTILTMNSVHDLFVQVGKSGTPVQCGTVPVTGITFTASGVSGNTVEFDETTTPFACIGISGAVATGSGAVVDIQAAAPGSGSTAGQGDVTVGTKTLDLAGCGSTQGKLTGVASYLLVGNGADTLSAAGEATPADPATVPVTFQAAAAGGGTETFDASDATGATSTIDFSQAYTSSTCTGTCSLVANSSGADLPAPGPADFTATISNGSNTVLSTYDYSADGSGVTGFDAIPFGPTTFYGEAGTYTLNGLSSSASSPPVTSQVIAGAGTETYTVTANNATFTSGTDSDTFQVTGNQNTFLAEPTSGTDNFFDTVPSGTAPSNTLNFNDVLTSGGLGGTGQSELLAINDSGAPQAINGGSLMTGAAAVGTPPTAPTQPPYNFANGPSSSSASNFTTIEGAATGFTQFLAGGTGGLTLTGQGSGNAALFYGNNGVVANLSGSPVTTSAKISASTTLSAFSLPSGSVLVAAPANPGNNTCALAAVDCVTLNGPNGTTGTIQSVTGAPGGFSTFYAGGATSGYNFVDQGGNNTFIGGTGPDNFTANGNTNDFKAGTGAGSFTDPGSGNIVDFSAQPAMVTLNVSGQQVQLTPPNAATVGTSTQVTTLYTFSASPATFIGSPGGTTFEAGGTADTFDGFSSTTTNILSFASSTQTTGGPLQVCVVAGTGCTAPGEAQLGTVDEQFTNISQFDGLSLGNTTFVAGPPSSKTFAATGGNNTIDYSAAGAGVTVNMPGTKTGLPPGVGQVALNSNPPPTVVDTISGLATVFGSATTTASQPNDFIAGAGSETFGDKGTAGFDAIDFTHVATSGGSPLLVNVSGGPEINGTLLNFNAVAGAATYNFATGGSNFTTLSGSSNGNTTFFAGNTGGYTFSASGNGSDAMDFTAATTPLTVNLGGTTTTGTVTGFSSGGPDSISGLTTVTAPPKNRNSFTAGSSPGATYNFTANSSGNTFVGGAGTDMFQSNGNNNTVTAGTGDVTFVDTSGSGNIMDFGSLPGGDTVLVNVSGQPAQTPINTALSELGATYTFGGTVATFKGAPAGTTFDAGGASDVFLGAPTPTTPNVLNFDNLPSSTTGPLQICGPGVVAAQVAPACSATPPTTTVCSGGSGGTAQLVAVPYTFCNITTYEGLPSGNTTFYAGTPNGSTFDAFVPTGTPANQANNSIDYSSAGSGVKVNMPGTLTGLPPGVGQVALNSNPPPTGKDSISGLATVFGSATTTASQPNDFIAGAGSETFGDNGTPGFDAIDFTHVATSQGSPLLVNVSGGPENNGAVQNFTAVAGSATYTFSTGGLNFTTLSGSSSGNTTFFAGSTGGYALSASGNGTDALDFTAATTPLTVNLGGSTTTGTVTGFSSGGPDSISGLTTVTAPPKNRNSFTAGSSPGATYNFTANSNGNTFVGGAGTDIFQTSGNNNTVTAGTGDVTFVDTSGSGNVMDFGSLPGGDTVLVNVSGQPAQTPINTALSELGATYTFGGTVATFKGAPAGTTFDAGLAQDAFFGAPNPTNPNVLNFDNLPSTTLGPLQICGPGVVAAQVAPACSATPPTTTVCSGGSGGTAQLVAVPYTFCNITTYEGLPSGNTTFYAGTPSNSSYEAIGTNQNVMSYAGAPNGVTLDFTVSTSGTQAKVTSTNPAITSEQDSVQNMTTVFGSAAGDNVFIAGSSNYTFTSGGNGNTFDGGPGTGNFTGSGSGNTFNVGTGPDTMSDTGSGNTISFNGVSTGNTTPLTVNVSGTPSGLIPNDEATVGSVTYKFISSGNPFTSFIGAANGFTDFLAPAAGGYSFVGSLTGNTADFSANSCAVTANMLTGTVGLTSATGCATTTTDSIRGITEVVGSSTGSNVFDGDLKGNIFASTSTTNTVSYAGYSASALCFNLTGTVTIPPLGTSSGTGDRVTAGCGGTGATDYFSVSPGSLTVEGTSNNDTFQIGAPGVTIDGGGGDDILDLSQVPAPPSGTAGVTLDLGHGTISGSSISGVSFTPGCGVATDLCVTAINGSRYDDTFNASTTELKGTVPAVTITGGGGNDTLNLTAIPKPATATVEMPIVGTAGTPVATASAECKSDPPGPTGYVCAPGGPPAIQFTGIPNINGTAAGGDYFYVGTGAAQLNEGQNGAAGTLDFSALPAPSPNFPTVGVTVDVSSPNGPPSTGGVSSQGINVSDSFVQMGTFVGTPEDDQFFQSGIGVFNFEGEAGSNQLTLSGSPANTQVTLGPPDSTCTTGPGIKNNDGMATGTGLTDNFSCMGQVVSNSSDYEVAPGQTATVNGNGTGTLMLADTAKNAQGVTITMPQKSGALGTVTGDGFNFAFQGMSTVDGTPYNDLFIPGYAPVSFNGGGGQDGVSFTAASGPAVVNLSSSPYAVAASPPTLTDAGNTVPADTAVGGVGGLSTQITLNGVSNVFGTSKYNDIIVGGPGPGTLVGGSGQETFVPTGGNDYINGGTGTQDTLDLSLLPSYSTFNLGSPALQQLGAGNGSLVVVPGTIETVIASPAGSTLQAGPGNITLVGGPGNDVLEAGTGNQKLMATTGSDTLVGGIGADSLMGGTAPVTFVPGQGGTDTLTTALTSPANTLSYQGAPAAAAINLSNQQEPVPAGQPFGDTVLQQVQAIGGWGATVKLNGAQILQVLGSTHADAFVTGSTPVNIAGGGGNDLFMVTGISNTMTAGPGSASDFLFEPGSGVSGGGNTIFGGGDSIADFSLAPAGVDVSLQTGQASGGFGGIQTLSGIQTVIGTNYPDTLIAGAKGQTLIGGDAQVPAPQVGGDFLQAAPAGGDTLISNGSGDDTFCAESSCNGGQQAAGGNIMKGGTGIDTFYAVNGAVPDTITGGQNDTAFVDPVDHVSGIPPSQVIVQ